MFNAADRDSDQFGIKMSAGCDLSLAGPIPQPCSKRGERWARRQKSAIQSRMQLLPRHSDKLKNDVPGGQAG